MSLGFGAQSALAAASSALDMIGNEISFNSSNSASKKAAKTAFLGQLYLMNKQNEYNKPINQMKRLEEAGLNPNLVYGNGAGQSLSATPSSVSKADVHARSTDGLNFIEKMQMTNALENQKLQNATLANNIRIADADLKLRAALNKAQIRNLSAGSKNQEMNNAFYSWLGEVLGPAGSNAGVQASAGAASGIGQFFKNLLSFKFRR